MNTTVEMKPLMLVETDEPMSWNDHLVHVGEHSDRQSFRSLFEHFAPLIKSYYLGKSPRSVNLIEELIQEVMVKVWQKAHTYDPKKAAASTWIFTLARNTYIDMLRRLNKYSTTSSIETEDIWEDTTEVGPLNQLETIRDSSLIRDSLSQLPHAQAQIIAKVYMDGKTHVEVANELDLPLGTVKSRVRLALNKLNNLLREKTA